MLKLLNRSEFTNKILKAYFTRRRLLRFDYDFDMADFGAKSKFDQRARKKLSNIVRRSCSPVLKSLLLAFWTRKRQARVILELGSCVGLNAIIIGQKNPQATVLSIEGDKTLYTLARRLVRILDQENVVFINDLFDSVLPEILDAFQPSVIFIDGNHSMQGTLAYFEQICRTVKPKVYIIIDDIDWSKGMREAWKKISCKRIKNKTSFVKFGIVQLDEKRE